MLGLRRRVRIETERMTLRLPAHADWAAWMQVRRDSAAFLTPWEPVWSHDHLARRSFTNRVYWAQRAEGQGTALPLLMFRREDQHGGNMPYVPFAQQVYGLHGPPEQGDRRGQCVPA